MSSILASSSSLLGPLAPINKYVLAHAQPFTSINWLYLLLPMIPLFVQCYLIGFEGTRSWRIAMAVVGLMMMTSAITSYRFFTPSYNFFNHGLGITYLHLGFQYVEFALLERPVIDPYITKARSRIISALDLSINSRIVGLGPVGLGGPTSHAKQSASTAGADGADGGVNIGGKESPDNHERWLPYVDTGRSRFQACLRHVIHSYVHFVVFDTLMHLARYYGSGTLNQPDGYPDALDALMSIKSFVLLPRTYPIRLPNSIVEIACELSLAAGVWQSLSWGYHLIAFLLVGSGFWETESWEVDLFDAPWKADSLMDLWGKRWHQLFRHHFVVLSTLTLSLLYQPRNSPLLLPLIFFLSGCLHVLGTFTMSPVPEPTPIALFFFLSGVGAALEVAFKRMTGRKVSGWAGRLWTWSFMLLTARMAARSWFDAGAAGNQTTPSTGPGRLAEPIAGWIIRWVVDEA